MSVHEMPAATLQRAEVQSEEMGRLSGDLDALSWDLDEALRNHRNDPDETTLAEVRKQSERASRVLAALDVIRRDLHRLADAA